MSDPSDPIDLSGQLEALKGLVSESNPVLYRHLALYLQVLRQVLPQRVRQACFHLATQIHPQRYAELPEESRAILHGQIERLVFRCSSLLTVEQLAILADQISRERQRRERHDQLQILAELTHRQEDELSLSREESSDSLPPGSVQLALAPPLSAGLHAWGWPRLRPTDPGVRNRTDPEDEEEDAPDDGDGPGSDEPPDLPIEESGPSTDPGSDGPRNARGEESLWQAGRLPREPQQVLQWMDGMELALARRLRNLSHAVNVELLRAGVNRSLLPVSLLDAVLSGQLDTLVAPPNLLRLSLPFGGGDGSHQAQTMAVLLRTPEVELEEPRLRTCRRRLQQHRQEVRRMAHQFRRLQRRLRIHQAEQLWLQDIRNSQTPSG